MRILFLFVAFTMPVSLFAQELRILSWNIESQGSDKRVIEEQLKQLQAQYDILALSEVAALDVISGAYTKRVADGPSFVMGLTGSEHKLIAVYDPKKYKLIEWNELTSFRGVSLNKEGECAPLILNLKINQTQRRFVLMCVKMSLEDGEVQAKRTKALVEWARSQSLPVLAVGDFNINYDVRNKKGTDAFSIMQQEEVFRWIKPKVLVDTHWTDSNSDTEDDNPNLLEELVFVSGPAKDWDAKANVVVREDDFPDDGRTSSHRPILITAIAK